MNTCDAPTNNLRKMNFLLAAVFGATSAASTLMGFGHDTTGAGSSAVVCHVQELRRDELQHCLIGNEPKDVVFDRSGVLSLDKPVSIGANKTVEGKGLVTVEGPWRLFDILNSNVIVRGLRFASTLVNNRAGENCAHPAGPEDVLGCGVSVNIRAPATDIWIDHNEFFHCGDKCVVVWADATPQQGRLASPDRISISNNYLHDSYFGILVGVDGGVPSSRMPAAERVTIYSNRFDNILRRSPQATSGAWVHFFNNIVEDFGGSETCQGNTYGFGSAAVGGAQLYAEGNVYIAWPRGCKDAVISQNPKFPAGFRGYGSIKAVGNLALNGAIVEQQSPSTVFDPHTYYTYRIIPTEKVVGIAMASAGIHQ